MLASTCGNLNAQREELMRKTHWIRVYSMAFVITWTLVVLGCSSSDCSPGDEIACACAPEPLICSDDGTAPACDCNASANADANSGRRSGVLTWQPGQTTVVDGQTGMTWQRKVDTEKYDWQAAQVYCDQLKLDGKEDWRLPHRDQLESIVLKVTTTPAIDTAAFPDTPAKPFWTRTLYPPNAGAEAFGVDFENGGTGHAPKTEPHYVRCVRLPPTG